MKYHSNSLSQVYGLTEVHCADTGDGVLAIDASNVDSSLDPLLSGGF
jgi:hypothetical protein